MASKYKRGNVWWLNWIENQTRHRASLGRVTEAEAEAQRLAKEHSIGISAAAGPDFATWATRYATWHSQEYPDSYYRVEQILRTHLIPAFGPLPLMAIDRATAEAYKQRRLAEASAGTVVKEWRTLQAMLNAAVAWDIIPRNPIGKVRAPRDLASRPPRWYTHSELDLIYRTEATIPPCTAPGDAELHHTYRWAWQLLANTGLRRTEALQLRWGDIGKDEIGVRSEEDARTKSGHWRVVTLTTGAREAVETLRPANPKRTAHVLPQLAPTSISRAFVRTLHRAGLDGHLHCLRHTFCSHLVQAGISLRKVQILAGHASIKTTERYAHLAPSTEREQVRALDL